MDQDEAEPSGGPDMWWVRKGNAFAPSVTSISTIFPVQLTLTVKGVRACTTALATSSLVTRRRSSSQAPMVHAATLSPTNDRGHSRALARPASADA